jgi:hypothetical protein
VYKKVRKQGNFLHGTIMVYGQEVYAAGINPNFIEPGGHAAKFY